MESRRKFLMGIGATGAAGLAGCLGGSEGDGENSKKTSNDGSGSTDSPTSSSSKKGSDKIMFALTPAEGDVKIEKQYKPMFDYIENEANVTVESTVAGDYTAVYSALKSGRADFADSSPSIALKGGKEGVTDVTGIRVAYGAEKYFSLLYSIEGSGVKKPADVADKTVAFADPLSTSGSIFPLYMLQEAGLDIGSAPKGDAEDFTGKWSDHSAAEKALRTRDEVVAAGTGAFAAADYIPKDQFPQRFKDISAEWESAGSKTSEHTYNLLSCSEPIPRAPIINRSDLNGDVKTRVSEAILSAEEEDLINENAEEELWFTGVKKGSVEDYQPVQDAFDAIGVEL
ncbi:PhnD/SsuA/transferrin family substrate-binding protein [Haloarchaeobius sp. TZWWS8]|uniref:PhnD/SsuA/transferrin family substrate-binding protein n=1 Tax=Haloarchaeobius sp. TZWWS8 TaxID=3446121 RepID=UPI003EBCD472